MIPEEFHQSLAEEGIEFTDHQINQSAIYYRTLVEWDEKMNLTTITDERDVHLKHFCDSLTLAFGVDFTRPLSLCDVGSGVGFPGVPLEIASPELQITIVGSLNKRIAFLSELTRLLGTDASLYHDRAEAFGRNPYFRASFDPVTARTVARLNVLAGLCLPSAKRKGYSCVLKAAKSKEELTGAKQAIALLSGKFLKEEAVTLPNVSDQRHIIIVQKKKPAPKKCPGKPGPPSKQPIK